MEEKPVNKKQVTEENCKDLLYEYAEKYYAGEFSSAVNECPYDLSDLDEELAFKEAFEWFTLERVQPRTGKTLLREFTEKFITGRDLRSKMLQMEQIFQGEFRVAELRGSEAVFICLRTGKKYDVKLLEEHKHLYKAGRTVICKMHPWGTIYKLAGITRIKPSEEELMTQLGIPTPDQLMGWLEKKEIKKAENIIVRNNSTVSSLLSKYPFQWVDGICNELGIDTGSRKKEKIKRIVEILHSEPKRILEKLPERSKEALAFVLKNGGVVKYHKLSRRFNDEIGFWWNESPPKSTVGLLRSHGLLFVGKTPFGEKMFKVAIVPAELREETAGVLSSIGHI